MVVKDYGGHPESTRNTGGRRAFTLVELLVAVSVVAILTLGIGQIFGSVSKLVGTGAAVAEVEQMSRTIEAQLRDDFLALGRMEEDETFLAIRNTRLGDLDLDGGFDPNDGEIALYLTPEDEEADVRANQDPYERNGQNEPLSRAVTVRLDEIMFIGLSGQGYVSFQGGQAGTVSSQHALISWGHGLRPPLDEDPEDTHDEEGERRLNYADGYFGSAPGEDNRFAPDTGVLATGRNQYASDFVLTRQALMLFGPTAFGFPNATTPSPALLGPDAEIAMYPRDLEAQVRVFNGDTDDIKNPNWLLGGFRPDGPVLGVEWWRVAKPHPIRHGRVDICAMDRDDVQRWFEGGVGPLVSPDGRAFEVGTLPYQLGLPSLRLWERTLWPGGGTPADIAYSQNLAGIQSAIAGTFTRKLIETEPPEFRFDPDDYNNPKPSPQDRRMDVHAILGEHCTNFEVAWSDGSVWNGGTTGSEIILVDLDGDGRGNGPGETEILPGERIWFDMDFTLSDFWHGRGPDWGGLTGNDPQKRATYPRPNPDPEIGLTNDRMFEEFPFPNEAVSLNRTHDLALSVVQDTAAIVRAVLGGYSTKYTQSAFGVLGDSAREYLAIWGFRAPMGYNRDLGVGAGAANGSVVGGYENVAWTKPRSIRIRVTLQDTQDRLVNGKTFEFVLGTNLN